MMYTGNPIIDCIWSQSLDIKSGKKVKIYVISCMLCKKYKRLAMGMLAAPGGSPSCPICRELKQGRGPSNSYGNIKINSFDIILPKEVD